MENKLLLTSTLDEFVKALVYALGISVNGDEDTLEKDGVPVKKHYVYGIKGLMELLQISRTTASRLKNSGVLDDAMSTSGRIVVFDADLVMSLLKATNRRKALQATCHGRSHKNINILSHVRN